MTSSSKLKIWPKGLDAFKLLHFARNNRNANHEHEITNMNKTSNQPSCWMAAHMNEDSMKIII